MQITTVMVVILFVWSVFTLVTKGGTLRDRRASSISSFSDDAVGG